MNSTPWKGDRATHALNFVMAGGNENLMLKNKNLFVFLLFFLTFWHHEVWGQKCSEYFRLVAWKNFRFGKEAKLLARGYPRQYIDGLDKVDNYLQLAKKLRRPGVDPRETHIPFFAAQISKHINFIESGMTPKRKTLLQEKLRLFRKRAYQRRRSKRVTYAWFVEWNVQLATLATPEEKQILKITSGTTFPELPPLNNESPYQLSKRGKSGSEVEEIFRQQAEHSHRKKLSRAISLFPQVIMMPTTDPMGLMAFNRTFPLGISFLGMLNKRVGLWNPQEFVTHDIEHLLGRIESMGRRADYKVIEPLHNAIMGRVENKKMSKEQREAFEYLYFLANHEWSNLYKAIMGASSRQRMERFLNSIPFAIYEYKASDVLDLELLRLLPKNVDLDSDVAIERFFKENMRFFGEEILLEVNR